MKARRLFWALPIATIALLGVLLVSTPLIVAVPVIQNYIITLAEQALGQQLGADVHIGSVGATLQGTVSVTGVSIRDRVGGDSLTIGRASADIALTHLLFRRISIPQIAVDDVSAALTRSDDGRVGPFRFAPVDTTAAQSGDTPWRVDLGVLALSNGTVTYRDTPIALQTSLAHINGLCRFARLDSLILDLEGQAGAIVTDTLRLDSLSLQFAGVVSASAVVFDPVRLTLPAASITLEGTLPYAPDTPWAMGVRLAVDHGRLAAHHPLLSVLPHQGRSELEARVDGPLTAPVINLRYHGTDLRRHNLHVSTLTCSASYSDTSHARVAVDIATTNRGTLSAHLEATLDSLLSAPAIRGYRLRARGTRLDLPWIARQVGPGVDLPRSRGRFSLSARGTGIDALPALASCELSIVLPDLPQPTPNLAVGTLRLSGKSWKSSIDWGQNALTADGTVQLDKGLSGAAQLVVNDPWALSAPFLPDTIEGAVQANATFTLDTALDLSASGVLSGEALRWRTAFLDSLRVEATFDNDEIMIRPSSAHGTVGLGGLLPHFGLEGIDGTVQIELAGEGPFDSPTTTLSLVSTDLSLPGFEHCSSACSFALTGDMLRWQECELRDSLLTVRSSGSLSLSSLMVDGSVHIAVPTVETPAQLTVRGIVNPDSLDLRFHLSDITTAMVASRLPGHALPEGTLGAEIDVGGTSGNPDVSATVQAPALTLQNDAVLSLQVEATLHDSLLRAETTVASAATDGHLAAHAVVPLRPSAKWQIDWDHPESPSARWLIDSIDCALFASLLPAGFSLDAGWISGSGSVRGANQEWIPTGTVVLSDVAAEHANEKLRLDSIDLHATVGGTVQAPTVTFACSTGTFSRTDTRMSIAAIVANGRLTADELVLDTLYALARDGGLSVSGHIPFGAAPTNGATGLAYQANCVAERFPLTLASPFLSGVDITGGELSADAWVRSGRTGVAMEGWVRISDVVTVLPDIKPDIGPLSVVARMKQDTVFLDSVALVLDRRRLHAHGWVGLPHDNELPLQLTAHGTDLALAYADMLDVRVDTVSMELAGASTPYQLDGRLVLARSQYRNPIRIADLAALMRSSAAAPSGDTAAWANLVRLNLRLRTSAPLVIDLELARVRLSIEALVEGPPATPLIGGTTRIVDGQVWYLDRKFEIERGVFQQTDPQRINPLLDILATTEVSPSMGLKSATRYKIWLRVGGTLESPTVDLQSNPSLSQVDIVSLLTLGRVRNANEEALALESGSELTDALAEKAKVLASQRLTGYVTRRLERWFSLDQVSIEGNIFGVGSGSGPRLSVSKQVRDRLTLSYQSVIGAPDEQSIRASFRVAPFVFLEGETDAQDEAGLDLKLKWSF